jgi:uncharacterized protein DUF4255
VNDQTIRDASRTLLDLLKANLTDIPTQIALASPKNAGTNLLTLFLYRVVENPELKNANRLLRPANGNGGFIEQPPPLTLDLYYLLTAYALADPLQAHGALSRAMRVFYDNGILHGSLLHTDNPGTGLTEDSVLRITLDPLTMEEMSRIWGVFPDTPYEISVAYLVTPVPIESARTEPRAPVVDQIHEHGQRDAELGR